jgi:hypothetical protein
MANYSACYDYAVKRMSQEAPARLPKGIFHLLHVVLSQY